MEGPAEVEEFEFRLRLEKEREFQVTPGGAVTGIARPRQSTLGTGRGFTEIGGATGLGAIAGAAAPELLTGAAGALRQFPQGARVAPLLESAAIAAKTAGRPSTAAAGAISGFGGETAGQFAEQMGAGPVTAETVRFVAGGVAPEAVNIGKWAINKVLQSPALSIESKMRKEFAKEVMKKLQGKPEDLDEKERQFLNNLIDELRGGPKTGTPMQGTYDILQRGAEKRIAVSNQQAQKLLSDAEIAARNEIEQTIKGPIAKSEAGVQRLKARGQDALSTAQLQRLNIGDDAELSDVGGSLRSVIVKKNQDAILARQRQFAADETERDAIVAANEGRRRFVNSLPEYEALVSDLTSHLKPGTRSPDVQKNYAHILSQVRNPEKDVFGQNKPISFQVLDDVRRKLGDVFSGTPAEGYEAISASDARKYYKMISDIQKKFAGGEGGPQDRLLKHYADATEGMEMFGSRLGKKATALDKYDDTRFQTDAAALPRQFFSTKQGVQDLIELSGDKNLVLKAAKDFATNELRGMDSQQVQAWMTKRRELLSALPDLRKSVTDYNNLLSRGEDIAQRTDKAVKLHESFQTGRIRESERTAAGLTREAETTGGQVRGEAQKAASVLMGREYPVERVRTLIESGDPNQWKLAAPEIMAAPGGKQMLVESVRQVMSDRASKSTVGLSDFYARNVRPALEQTKIMTAPEIQFIATKLESIENMKIPEPQKLGLMKRFLLQSFGGLASSVGARAGTATASSLADLIPQ